LGSNGIKNYQNKKKQPRNPNSSLINNKVAHTIPWNVVPKILNSSLPHICIASGKNMSRKIYVCVKMH
jgi:hypothetical protein